MFDIVCGANFFWESTLWQRPHHIISRLSRDRKILYIRPVDFEMYMKNCQLRRRYGSFRRGPIFLFSPLIFPYGGRSPAIRAVNNLLMTWRVRSFVKREGFKSIVLWLYSPMSYYLAGKLDERLLVYDCMDDHASFRNAVGDIAFYEEKVLEKSDIVFAGGKSLFELRKEKNRSTYLFPSAVDSKHFARALLEKTPVPGDLKNIPSPVIGYFGAVDERLNYTLIEQIAKENPKWSFVFIGPVVKVSEDELPKGENIHFIGEREYSDLPAYIKGFNVGFMPFALNSYTERISPTKTLEYLAAGCPVVSTPVPDIVSTFQGVVRFSNDTKTLAGQIQGLLAGPGEAEFIEEGFRVAAASSWDSTVQNMLNLIREKMG